jgi:hypothetical protein
MAPYDGAAPIEGLGADTMIAPSDWPYVLRTDGFFGAPTSQYTWNTGSHADTLEVSGPGTYSVAVTFPDGCNISDEIVLTEGIPLPVTLRNFHATLENNCSGIRLGWSTASEQNSAAFVIQRSKDGNSWNDIHSVPAAGNSDQLRHYSYTDRNMKGSDQFMYRLLMKDIDGRQKYSSIVSVRLNCESGSYLIYSNPVLTVYNVSGQRIARRTLQPGTVQTISAAGWHQGIYMAVITENGKQVHTEKLMKQ